MWSRSYCVTTESSRRMAETRDRWHMKCGTHSDIVASLLWMWCKWQRCRAYGHVYTCMLLLPHTSSHNKFQQNDWPCRYIVCLIVTSISSEVFEGLLSRKLQGVQRTSCRRCQNGSPLGRQTRRLRGAMLFRPSGGTTAHLLFLCSSLSACISQFKLSLSELRPDCPSTLGCYVPAAVHTSVRHCANETCSGTWSCLVHAFQESLCPDVRNSVLRSDMLLTMHQTARHHNADVVTAVRSADPEIDCFLFSYSGSPLVERLRTNHRGWKAGELRSVCPRPLRDMK
jgi:hypothetical protein